MHLTGRHPAGQKMDAFLDAHIRKKSDPATDHDIAE
jgi:hypothetical protein